tara:strand:+ start:267 stop:419 length:153 start_codon:yes stop_codon:yes gene_type:complete
MYGYEGTNKALVIAIISLAVMLYFVLITGWYDRIQWLQHLNGIKQVFLYY